MTPENFKIITQNCFFGRIAVGLTALINQESPDIFCLQEVTSNNLAEQIKSEIGYDYKITQPNQSVIPGLSFRNSTYSNLLIVDSGELNWAKSKRTWIEPFGGKSLWVDVQMGRQKLRVYNCYFSVIDQGMVERGKMWEI